MSSNPPICLCFSRPIRSLISGSTSSNGLRPVQAAVVMVMCLVGWMEVATGRGCEEGRRMGGNEVVVMAGKCFLASSCLEVFVHCTDNRKDRCHFSTLQTNNAHSAWLYYYRTYSWVPLRSCRGTDENSPALARWWLYNSRAPWHVVLQTRTT